MKNIISALSLLVLLSACGSGGGAGSSSKSDDLIPDGFLNIVGCNKDTISINQAPYFEARIICRTTNSGFSNVVLDLETIFLSSVMPAASTGQYLGFMQNSYEHKYFLNTELNPLRITIRAKACYTFNSQADQCETKEIVVTKLNPITRLVR